MAKKQTLSLLEMHLEKIALAAAGIVFLLVVVWQFFLTTGIEIQASAESLSVTEAAKQAAGQAEQIRLAMRSGKAQVEPLEPLGDFIQIAELQVADRYRAPLGMITPSNLLPQKQIQTIDNFPRLADLGLQGPKTKLYHTQAWVPGADNTEQVQDVDFVTLEARLPLAQIRKQFQAGFANPQLKVPVKNPEPILAAVDLQRSSLLPDGGWSPWKSVSRLDIGPLAIKDQPSEDFSNYTKAEFEVLMGIRSQPETQYRICQPQPYALVDEYWLPPTELEAQKKLEQERSRPAPGPRGPAQPDQLLPRDRNPRNAPAAPTQRGPAPPTRRDSIRPAPTQPGRGTYDQRYGGPTDYTYPGRVPTGREYYPGPTGIRTGRTGLAGGPVATEAQDYLEKDEITLWAHDGSVVPGVIYRYRLRVGVFNPIAGTDWFKPQDQQYKNQAVLWTPFTPSDDKDYQFVKVPKRVHFFPKTSGATEKAVASVDIYRWQNGQWYHRPYRITPGSVIGQVDEPFEKKSGTTAANPATSRLTGTPEPAKIDFSTGATVIDIVPKSTHWYRSGASLNQETTTDIVYRDTDGAVRRLAVDSRCWPQDLRQKRTEIIKAIRDQESAPAATTPLNPRASIGPTGRSRTPMD